MKRCMLLIGVVSLLLTNALGKDELASSIKRILRQSSLTNDISSVERQLVACLDENSTSEDRGLVYAAIAEAYGRDLQRHAMPAMRCAQIALSNDLSVIDTCRQNLLLACAQTVLAGKGEDNGAVAVSECGRTLVRSLSYVLDHQSSEEDVSSKYVGKYDCGSSGLEEKAFEVRHEEEEKARSSVLLQNKLAFFRDEFCWRLIELYGYGVLEDEMFKSVLDEARLTPKRKQQVIACVKKAIQVKRTESAGRVDGK